MLESYSGHLLGDHKYERFLSRSNRGIDFICIKYENLQLIRNCLLIMLKKKKKFSNYINNKNECGYSSETEDVNSEDSDSEYDSGDDINTT